MTISLENYVAQRLAEYLKASDKPRAMLLTCMDYRYPQRVSSVMDNLGMRGKYDVFVLAGAALGANRVPEWRKSFFDHVRTAITIGHPIEEIFILEHRDCGAYREFLKLDPDSRPSEEFNAHLQQVQDFAELIKQEFQVDIPKIKIEAILLTRDEDDELL